MTSYDLCFYSRIFFDFFKRNLQCMFLYRKLNCRLKNHHCHLLCTSPYYRSSKLSFIKCRVSIHMLFSVFFHFICFLYNYFFIKSPLYRMAVLLIWIFLMFYTWLLLSVTCVCLSYSMFSLPFLLFFIINLRLPVAVVVIVNINRLNT